MIYNEDCFKTMQRMMENEEKIDLILTSPPYNTEKNVHTERARANHESRYDIYLDTKTPEQYRDWTISLFTYFNEVLARDGVVLYNISYGSQNKSLLWLLLADIINKTEFMIADCITWKKPSALPNNGNNGCTRVCEFVFVFCRKSEERTFRANKRVTAVREDNGQKTYSCIYNFIEAKNNDGANPLNKATFSSGLVEKLLDMYYVGGKVYDPFMGIGTTALVCKNRNIECVGSELSEAQCKYAQERLNG